jgi:hypothetical protein
MAQETLGRDINGAVDFSLPYCISGASTTLAANTEQTFTTPPGFNRAFFSYSLGTNVFFDVGKTVTLPGGSFASSTAELNPGVRQISNNGGEAFHFISDTTAYVQIRFDQGGK